jgi:hypothetical protein
MRLHFFSWFLAAPWYFYKTRGKQGLLLGLAIWSLAVAPALVSSVIEVAARVV